MLKKAQKKTIVTDLAEQFKAAKAGVFSDFSGLGARDVQTLRQALKKENVSYKVVKLTLIKRALRLAGFDVSSFNFAVPVSVSLSGDDETATARILQDFAKKHEQLKMVSGILDHKLIDSAQVKALATLPDKQTLRGQLVGVIAGPLRGFVTVLSGNLRGLVNVLNAIKDSKV